MTLKNADLLDFANSFADESRKILRKNYFKKFNIEKKKDGSLVTDVDKEIEILFRKKLKKKYRDHGVIGEEFESEKVGEELVWVIDPLDGTHSFIAGKPMFGTLICCLRNKVPIIGIIDIPILNQRWYGGNGLGVKLNGKNLMWIMFDRCPTSACMPVLPNSKLPSFLETENDISLNFVGTPKCSKRAVKFG